LETIQTRSPIRLDERDFRILAILESRPLASTASIAENLGCKSETVATHIQHMKERGVYQGTVALLSYIRFELRVLLVAVNASLKNLSVLNAACRAHPYVTSVVSTQGAMNGVLVTVKAPNSALHLTIQFFDELAAQGTIEDYNVYLTDESELEFLKPDLRTLDLTTGTWNFDWENWETSSGNQNIHRTEKRRLESGLHMLGHADLELLRLVSDGKILGDATVGVGALSPHTVRRRIRLLAEHGFIIGYRAAIAYAHLGLSNNVLFNCKARPSTVSECKSKILQLPFPGMFIPTQEGFLIQSQLPSDGTSSILRFLFQMSEHVELSWCGLISDYNAPLNTAACQSGTWRVDADYLLANRHRIYKETHQGEAS
jgi:DNA-binding Lrp family transcriptional regulator